MSSTDSIVAWFLSWICRCLVNIPARTHTARQATWPRVQKEQRNWFLSSSFASQVQLVTVKAGKRLLCVSPIFRRPCFFFMPTGWNETPSRLVMKILFLPLAFRWVTQKIAIMLQNTPCATLKAASCKKKTEFSKIDLFLPPSFIPLNSSNCPGEGFSSQLTSMSYP